ncbi:hypothetical protein M8J77_024231 [Diaphorina citri]|nr:hypothetical protein M8J77_012926 [Diaphorina citri]KAI5739858.1 hypothetical protein M8J77_024231 [Diaphorina citri]
MSYNQKVKKHIGLKTKYLNSIKATFDLIDCEDKRSTFLVRCEKMDIVYQSFETAINKLIELNAEVPEPEGEDETDIEKDSNDCDAMFYAIKAALRELTPAPPNPSSSLDPAHVTREDELKKPRIPKINIEPFAGAIEQFSSFKSLYDTLIHNSNLSNIEKFSYLLSLLKGKALLTVKAFEFNDANYLRAYNKLSEEFSNPRLVATHYLNKNCLEKCLPAKRKLHVNPCLSPAMINSVISSKSSGKQKKLFIPKSATLMMKPVNLTSYPHTPEIKLDNLWSNCLSNLIHLILDATETLP